MSPTKSRRIERMRSPVTTISSLLAAGGSWAKAPDCRAKTAAIVAADTENRMRPLLEEPGSRERPGAKKVQAQTRAPMDVHPSDAGSRRCDGERARLSGAGEAFRQFALFVDAVDD